MSTNLAYSRDRLCSDIGSNAVGKLIREQHNLPFEVNAIKIAPGEHYVTADREDVIITVLGSCVSACIRDPFVRIGGMNHFMLPESKDGMWGKAKASLRFGNFAMELLVNDILKRGGLRERLEVKIVGGGNVLENVADVGERNAEFVEQYLAAEGLKVLSVDLRGDFARRVHYQPYDGRMWVKRLARHVVEDVKAVETNHYRQIASAAVGGTVEVF